MSRWQSAGFGLNRGIQARARWQSSLISVGLATIVSLAGGWQWVPSAEMFLNPVLNQQHNILTQLHMVTSQVGWAIIDQHVSHTTDGGQTWQALGPRIPTGAFVLLVGLDARDAGIVIETGNVAPLTNRYWWTTNTGQAWHSVRIPWSRDEPPVSIQMLSPQRGWILTEVDPEAGNETAVVLHTTDGGTRWMALPSSAFPPNRPSDGNARTEPNGLTVAFDKNGVTFRSPQVGWVTGGNAYPHEVVFDRTTNGGKTFAAQPLPAIDGQAIGETDPPIFTTLRTGWLPVQIAHGQGFERTANGGQTWVPTTTVFNTSHGTTSWSFVGLDDGWLLANHHLYRTRNCGATWQSLATYRRLPHWTAIDFVSPTQGWATTTSTTTPLWETTDGGVHWTPMQPTLVL